MKRSMLAVMALVGFNYSFAAEGTLFDWGYAKQTAPAQWGKIKPEYQACEGVNQAPINIDQTISAKLPALKLNYSSKADTIINNHRTVQINFAEGNTLELDHKLFHLKQFHLHSPSENTIKGKSFAMEMHLVHATEQGELAVIAVMFDEGQENKKLKQLWKELPKKAGNAVQLKHQDLAAAFLPEKLDYYRFNGSLTTPPCSEGVRWIVLKDIQQASKQQIKAFSSLLEHPNNRPVQPTNARLVLE
ncbi:carbonic anhydrase family protein [Acinetobacter sp. ANC 3781]|uniref:carbonic anhydrase n=1 Tax=Acinetobacter sp. ANC 3781 TaxID=2529835 RepID=UPI001038DE65|nr:carbonic anhydrase family protein [Acinetobacter sp. ANC 3781]TCB78594.1 carbonic anhydrase family protein [Acinetobacter sp. ANC 3781]